MWNEQIVKKIPFSPPDITEAEAKEVVEALKSGWITTGPRVKKLEANLAEYFDTSRVVCLNSATASLELTLRILGIGPGDEVITSAYTYTASASPVIHIGAHLVLVDTAPDSYEMDYDKVEDAITEHTKAIIPIDFGGVPCDYHRLYKIVNAKKRLFQPTTTLQESIGRIAIIADCAHALGAVQGGKHIGNIADFSTFSFHAVKNFTTAEGGCATWRDISGVDNEEIYHEYQLLSLHGQNKDALAKTKLGAWEYDIKGCYYKCNMTDVMAAIGLVQLQRYAGLLQRRQEIMKIYEQGMADIPVEIMTQRGQEWQGSGHLCAVRLLGKKRPFRDAFITAMAEHGVSTNVHYKPLPMHTAYRKLGFNIKEYPQAYAQFENEVTLPLHTLLTDEDVAYIIAAFHKCYAQVASL